ncbi:MAG: sugar phosphate isomerase/epimerase [Lentisphaerae bacterium]|mgnify:CR=1 FL=1|jgi:D-psicose/D-tagatose/L-ribulose 3-epimerase|nr:sugar phosphate isomerase/epimerase [Lentisphaerota bacterium]
MRFGICVAQDKMADVAAAGFDFCELSVYELLEPADGAEFAAWAEKIRNAPAPVEAVNAFFTGGLRVTGPDVDYKLLESHIEKTMRRAGIAGIKIVVFGSGGARKLPDGYPVEKGWQDLATVARMAAEYGAIHGVTTAMEPLLKKACNFFNTVAQGSDFVDRVNHPNLQLLGDLFHMADNGESFTDLINAGDRLAHIHVATPSLPETGDGIAYDFDSFFDALRQSGYDGRITVEDNPGLLWKIEPPLTDAYRAILNFVRAKATR